MNLLITISLFLALALVIMTVSRCLEWWERRTFRRDVEEARRHHTPVLLGESAPRRKAKAG